MIRRCKECEKILDVDNKRLFCREFCLETNMARYANLRHSPKKKWYGPVPYIARPVKIDKIAEADASLLELKRILDNEQINLDLC